MDDNCEHPYNENERTQTMAEHTLLRKLEVLWGCPIFCTDESEKDIRGFGVFSENQNPLTESEELVHDLIQRAKELDVPAIIKVFDKIYFFCVRSDQEFYLSGPVCAEQLSYVEIHQFYKKYHMSVKEERHPDKMNLNRILNFVSFLYELLEGRDLQPDELMEKNNLIEEKEIREEDGTVRIELDKVDGAAYHHTYMEERYVMDCIRAGNVEEINERAAGLFEKAGTLSKNHFNDQRNLAIVTVTMATREAIAGGVSPADSYRLSDYLINQIDQCRRIEEITELNRRSLYKFTKLVADTKKTRNFSSYTEQCKDYISQNYHHKIYLEDIAEAIGISQGHLSRIFRRDMGMKIQEYILKFRVERAANLLKYSDATLSDISDYVCFNSQSHFGSVFKEYMKMTPGQYREKYKRKEFYT